MKIMSILASRRIKLIFSVILLVGLFLSLLNFYGIHVTVLTNHKNCVCGEKKSCPCIQDANVRKYNLVQKNGNADHGNLSKTSKNAGLSNGVPAEKKSESDNKIYASSQNGVGESVGDHRKKSEMLTGFNKSRAVGLQDDLKTDKNLSKKDKGHTEGSPAKDLNRQGDQLSPVEKDSYAKHQTKDGRKRTNSRQTEISQNGIKGEGTACKIPKLDPYHQSIKHLLRKPSPLECAQENRQADLTYYDEHSGKIYINHTVLDGQSLNACSYSYIVMLDDSYTVFNESTIVEFDEDTDFSKDVVLIDNIVSDYFGVICQVGNSDKEDGEIYSDLHAHVVPQSHVFQRARDASPLPSSALGVDVIIVGFDSTSRMNFMRQMPKSYKFLTAAMESTVLEGFNIVGDATSAALIPMLTGHFPEDLPEARRNTPGATTVDAFPLIWKEFRNLGYATLFAEDSPYLGAFSRLFNGFEEQPTDHYMRAFWLKSVELTDDYNSISNPKVCQGARPAHQVTFDYLKEFQVKYKDIRKFAFVFMTELTHGNINSISLADDDFHKYLTFMYEKKYLDNTVFVVLGDHGARYTAIRGTLQGRLEERLPFVSIHIPQALRQTHPAIYKNLQINTDRLTTAFDFHAMLEDVIGQAQDANDSTTKHGYSLFQEIPASRGCLDAHVAMHWCACLDWVSVNQTDPKVQHAAGEFVKYINNLTEAHRQYCAVLQIKNISHAERNVPNNKVLRFKGTWDEDQRFAAFEDHALVDVHEVAVDYQITVETIPGRGLFEGTVRIFTDADGKDECVVDREISRINLYGDQPKCIAEKYPHLTKYCYCKNNDT